MATKPKPEDNKAEATIVSGGDTGSAQSGAAGGGVANLPLAQNEPTNPPVQPKGAGLLDPDAPSDILTTATIIVRGPAKGRWRIGRRFGPEPVSIPEADLTVEQKHALANDPELLIQLIDPAY